MARLTRCALLFIGISAVLALSGPLLGQAPDEPEASSEPEPPTGNRYGIDFTRAYGLATAGGAAEQHNLLDRKSVV